MRLASLLRGVHPAGDRGPLLGAQLAWVDGIEAAQQSDVGLGRGVRPLAVVGQQVEDGRDGVAALQALPFGQRQDSDVIGERADGGVHDQRVREELVEIGLHLAQVPRASQVHQEYGRPRQAGPVVRENPKSIVYGPLRDMPIEPSVILVRLNGKQQMLLHDAWPRLRFEGKPQCHIIAIAQENYEVALSARLMPALVALTAVAFLIGGIQAYLAPDDYQQGATVKIMFIHVPTAWLGIFAWVVMSSTMWSQY